MAIVSVVIVAVILIVNQMTVPYPGVPKYVDSINCEIFIIENDLPQGIGQYDQECLEFQSLPLTEQYEIYEQEKEEKEKVEKVLESAGLKEKEPEPIRPQCGSGTVYNPEIDACVLK